MIKIIKKISPTSTTYATRKSKIFYRSGTFATLLQNLTTSSEVL